MAAPLKIALYYDVVSPYSYIAFETLLRYCPVWKADLELHPVLLGGVQKVAGSAGVIPAANLLKRQGMGVDLARLFPEYGLPRSSIPTDFPSKDYLTLNAIRVLRVLKQRTPDALVPASRRFYQALFENHVLPTTPAYLQTLCAAPPVLTEHELAELLAAAQTPENKAGCIADAEDVVRRYGCWGFPWIVVTKPGGEQACFFGSDRMSSIAWWLGDGYSYSGPFPGGATKAAL